MSGPSGALAVSVPTLDETLDRNSDHFVGFARFTVPEDGDYRIQVVGGAEPTTIIVTPSLGSGFRQVGGWLAGAGGSIPLLGQPADLLPAAKLLAEAYSVIQARLQQAFAGRQEHGEGSDANTPGAEMPY